MSKDEQFEFNGACDDLHIKNYLEQGKIYKYMIELEVNDVFIKEADILEFIQYRLNLKYAVKVKSIKPSLEFQKIERSL